MLLANVRTEVLSDCGLVTFHFKQFKKRVCYKIDAFIFCNVSLHEYLPTKFGKDRSALLRSLRPEIAGVTSSVRRLHQLDTISYFFMACSINDVNERNAN